MLFFQRSQYANMKGNTKEVEEHETEVATTSKSWDEFCINRRASIANRDAKGTSLPNNIFKHNNHQ